MSIIAYIAIAYIVAFVVVAIYRARSEMQPLKEVSEFETAKVRRAEPAKIERREPEKTPAEPKGRGKWQVHQDGKKYGPVDTGTLQKWVEQGRIKRGALVWRKGMEKWGKITEIEQFRSRLR